MKEYEEEERQKRVGPGGLDPVEVYESLPTVSSQEASALFFYLLVSSKSNNTVVHLCSELQEMQKCFDEKDIQMLQDVISKMDPTVGSFVKVHSFVFDLSFFY